MPKFPHPIVQLARAAILEYLTRETLIDPPAVLPPEMDRPAGVFVSLKKDGRLRGCVGTFEPTTPSIAQEVIHNAVSAANGDPRFAPVTLEEMRSIRCSVDVLTPMEPVASADELDPGRYGVMVERDSLRGLLLPDLDGVETVAQQLEIAARKAGINPGYPDDPDMKIFRFEVKRYYEQD
ncbi:MAG: AmmeMemoRadiSam system protein A [Nitrospirae bacterium]|nr:AmmeMemoRadiSam system protein A [Nitrospirota bacterium]